jgi:hypothetical protein
MTGLSAGLNWYSYGNSYCGPDHVERTPGVGAFCVNRKGLIA